MTVARPWAELAPLSQAISATSSQKFSGGLRPVLGRGRGDHVEKDLLLTPRSTRDPHSPAGAGSCAGSWDTGRAARGDPPSVADGLRTRARVTPSLPWERPSCCSEATKGGVEAEREGQGRARGAAGGRPCARWGPVRRWRQAPHSRDQRGRRLRPLRSAMTRFRLRRGPDGTSQGAAAVRVTRAGRHALPLRAGPAGPRLRPSLAPGRRPAAPSTVKAAWCRRIATRCLRAGCPPCRRHARLARPPAAWTDPTRAGRARDGTCATFVSVPVICSVRPCVPFSKCHRVNMMNNI